MVQERDLRTGKSVDSTPELHLIFGAGGSKAILASTGAIAAFELANLNSWRSIGGVSGGSIVASLTADGAHAKELVWLAMNSDFSQFLKPNLGPLGRFWAFIRKYRNEAVLKEKGAYSAEPLRRLIDTSVSKWPENLWLVCTDKKFAQIVISKDGSLRFDGTVNDGTPLTDDMPSVGQAVSASCAIPGIIDSVELHGQPMFDGALGPEGACAIHVPEKLYGADPSKIVVVDVGEDDIKNSWLLRLLWKIGCNVNCAPFFGPHISEDDGVILVQPKITGFHGLKFLLDKLDKWNAIIASYRATIDTLVMHGLVTRAKNPKAFGLYDDLDLIPMETESRTHCVECIEKLFASYGVL
ncbi:MAG: patatin-like phospholipase family protein [Candidatus Obscuribacterales bacterium]|nr:patatin-like phospholipase family protein [Candidatus Obscuribacterales bacterium]